MTDRPTHARSRFAAWGVASLLGGGLLLASGCTLVPKYQEGGGLASFDAYTYVSRPYQPQTVSLIDTRTDEVLWSVDVPVGKQLSMEFLGGKGNETGPMPDLMKWDILDAGTGRSGLANGLPVPPPESRRVDVSLRATPEFPR
ncbi:MAG: hypothetical protein ACF8SC_03320 [Phycisphaerales bacterium JB037]